MPEITDQTYGLFPGLNCRTIGEDLVLLKNTACVNIFNALYISLVTVGISSFALLLAMCCMVCAGVRQYKQVGKLQSEQHRLEEIGQRREDEDPESAGDVYHAINYPDA